MSSKVGPNQQQGRRTPLSLTGGGKHAQQQQNKANSNLTKIQESKSDTTASAPVTKNGNHNAAKNQESNNLTQKELKKAAQQNGNGNSNDAANSGSGNVEIAGNTKNGTANGHKNNKNNAAKTELAKEKDNKETENNKEKPKKSETAKQTEEKKQSESAEQPTVQQVASPIPATTTATKSKEGAAAKSNTPTNEKKQTATAKANAHASGQKSVTPTKAPEKGTATPNVKSPGSKSGTPSKSPGSKSGTPSKSPRGSAAKSASIVDEAPVDVEMMPLLVEQSPPKKAVVITPTATSTPGKVSTRRDCFIVKDEPEMEKDKSSGSPEQSDIPRVFSQISGRRSIRPLESFTPNKYNSQFRESYRRINTELDVTSNTNTSMNVTVGSEIPNNSSFLSFSLFGRGRKRERTPPSMATAKSQSAVELTTETTPQKRPRLDVNGIFTAISSPLTLLRSRFSKTTLESSTPAKLKETTAAHAEDDVQNVSGVSIEEVDCNSSKNAADITEDITVGQEVLAEKTPNKKSSPIKMKKADKNTNSDEPAIENANESKEAPAMDVDSDIQMKETPIIAAVGDPKAKQRGCTLM